MYEVYRTNLNHEAMISFCVDTKEEALEKLESIKANNTLWGVIKRAEDGSVKGIIISNEKVDTE